MLPFTIEDFFGVFRQYNEAAWPAPIVLNALALAGIGLTLRRRRDDWRRMSAILAVLWLWMAIAYHGTFFRAVNPAAGAFAVAFGLQSLLFIRDAWRAGDASATRVGPPSRASTAIGVLLVTYALVGYPLVGWMMGHRYPAAPTFGVPCPTTIYTLGVLVWWLPGIERRLFVVPVAWALVGAVAAARLDVPEDWGLPVAAAMAMIMIAFGHHARPVDFRVVQATK